MRWWLPQETANLQGSARWAEGACVCICVRACLCACVCLCPCLCAASAPGRPSGAPADGGFTTFNMGVSRLPRTGRFHEPGLQVAHLLSAPFIGWTSDTAREAGKCGPARPGRRGTRSCAQLRAPGGGVLGRNTGLGHADLGLVPHLATCCRVTWDKVLILIQSPGFASNNGELGGGNNTYRSDVCVVFILVRNILSAQEMVAHVLTIKRWGLGGSSFSHSFLDLFI